LSIIVTLLSRVYFLSIKSNTYYEELSKNNYISRINKTPIRGIIEDRNGEKIAINEMGFSISIKPHLRGEKKRAELEKIIDLIIKHLPNLKKEKLIKTYLKEDSAYNHNFINIVDYVPYDEFFPKYTVLASNEDIKIDSSTKRFYPFKEAASHVIGYTGKASKNDILNNEIAKFTGTVGKNGIEKYYKKSFKEN